MTGGPSPSSTSPSNHANSPFLRDSISSASSSSPPKQPFSALLGFPPADPFSFAMPGTVDHFSQLTIDNSSQPAAEATVLVLDGLPQRSTRDDLTTLLLFTRDDVTEYDLMESMNPHSQSAFAIFRTEETAIKARDMLKGKIAVRLSTSPPPRGTPAGANGSRRNTVDSASARQGSISSSMASPIGPPVRQSRYQVEFDKAKTEQTHRSPPNGGAATVNGTGFATTSWGSLPQSPPVGTTLPSCNVGWTLITGEGNDDDGLLQEAVGQGTGSSVPRPVQRRPTNPPVSVPGSRVPLSLNTNGATPLSPPLQHFGANGAMSPPALSQYSSHASTPAASMTPMSGASRHAPSYPPYLQGPTPFAAQPPPPFNPSDQNPPCNTLYVGNLPADTNEDELKQLFQRQRGFKRLSFRTKANGPMCFVEFEDISLATRALSELYGVPLSNSIKGGIRLSFSKNPLGVRGNQQAAMGAASANNPAAMSGYGGAISAPPGFAAPHRPPPGLPAPSPSNPGYSFTNGVSSQGPSNGYAQRPAGAVGQTSNGQFAPISSASVGHVPGGPFSSLPNSGVGFMPNGAVGSRNDNYGQRRNNNNIASDDNGTNMPNGTISNGGPAAFNGHYYTQTHNGYNHNGH